MKANIILAEKYGEYECNGDGVEYEMNEETLGNHIKDRYYQIIEEPQETNDDGANDNDQIEPNEGEPELNGDEVEKPVEETYIDHALNDGTDLAPNDSRLKITENVFKASWNYAKTKIIPIAYKESISMNDETNKYYSSKPALPSFYCSGLKLYENLMSKQRNLNIRWDIIWAFILVGICSILGIIFCMRSRNKNENESDPKALNAANLCLDVLSQNQTYHFSIDNQMRAFAVSRLNVSDETWKKTVKYVNDSSYVTTEMDKDIYAPQITKCWKWKAPVPFVPLSNNS